MSQGLKAKILMMASSKEFNFVNSGLWNKKKQMAKMETKQVQDITIVRPMLRRLPKLSSSYSLVITILSRLTDTWHTHRSWYEGVIWSLD